MTQRVSGIIKGFGNNLIIFFSELAILIKLRKQIKEKKIYFFKVQKYFKI